ncbi:hypothetical protein NC651_009968 [Populus alba x Populus x berolinensis]|nr:hypothetical protein NC651_009968 [Populus alba x Populus x berolinensis]
MLICTSAPGFYISQAINLLASHHIYQLQEQQEACLFLTALCGMIFVTVQKFARVPNSYCILVLSSLKVK